MHSLQEIIYNNSPLGVKARKASAAKKQKAQLAKNASNIAKGKHTFNKTTKHD